ncbi:MAG: prolipoprotein diacylglyceryl transferase [Deltaproteobacteria bacterium]|jgi:prolipoprotein diacylglyceryl transferase|nr:prolipoprotein diacylglyceryl transferase [Deltaproteobacteria bacterium]
MRLIWDIDPVIFRVPGPDWPIHYYGLMFSLTFLGGFFLYRWQIGRGGGSEEEVVSFIIPGFLGVILGARIGHILFYNLDYFLANPLWFFRIWEGGLTSHGATLGLVAALYWQSRRKKRPFFDETDRFSFSAALGAALVRIGNLFNSEIVGKTAPDDAWVAFAFPRHDFLPPELAPYRYPTQIAEAALGFFVLFALFLADRLMGREKRPKGALSAIFLVLYFSGRFAVEFWKERQNAEDVLFLSRGQMLSVVPFLAGVALMFHAFKRRNLPESRADFGRGERKKASAASRGSENARDSQAPGGKKKKKKSGGQKKR